MDHRRKGTIHDLNLFKAHPSGNLSAFLRQLNYIAGIDLTEHEKEMIISEIVECLAIRVLKPNTIIFSIGDVSNDFYVLIEGSACVFVPKVFNQALNCRPAQLQHERTVRSKLLRYQYELKYTYEQQEEDYWKKQIAECERELEILQVNSELLPAKCFRDDPEFPHQCLLENVFDLRVGDCFGEMSFILEQLRTSTVVTRTGVLLGTLGKEDFFRIFAKRKTSLEYAYNQLRPIFQYARIEELANMSYQMVLQKYIRNQEVFHMGDNVDGFYLVRRGNVILSSATNQHLCVVPEGQCFGFEDLFQSTRSYTASVDACDTLLYFYNKKYLRGIADTELYHQLKRIGLAHLTFLRTRFAIVSKPDKQSPKVHKLWRGRLKTEKSQLLTEGDTQTSPPRFKARQPVLLKSKYLDELTRFHNEIKIQRTRDMESKLILNEEMHKFADVRNKLLTTITPLPDIPKLRIRKLNVASEIEEIGSLIEQFSANKLTPTQPIGYPLCHSLSPKSLQPHLKKHLNEPRRLPSLNIQ